MISGFTELETIGGEFTWSNGAGALHTRSKLDRVLGNAHWITRWPQVRPRLVFETTSDHAGIHIQLTRIEKGTTPFKFYNSWLRERDFNDQFKEAWDEPVEGSSLYVLQQKINQVRRMAKSWINNKKLKNVTSQ